MKGKDGGCVGRRRSIPCKKMEVGEGAAQSLWKWRSFSVTQAQGGLGVGGMRGAGTQQLRSGHGARFLAT